MDVSARPANHSSARERAGNKDEREILPPDHLNGVKLEMDGHLNKDFHQEVFLGKDIDGFEEDAEPRRSRRKLMVIFSKWVPRPGRCQNLTSFLTWHVLWLKFTQAMC